MLHSPSFRPPQWASASCLLVFRQESHLVLRALSQLAYYKAPGYVAFVDALPLTATNKIQRGELKKLAPTLPDTPECVNTCHMKKRQEPA